MLNSELESTDLGRVGFLWFGECQQASDAVRQRREASVDALLAQVRWAWDAEARRGDRGRELCLGTLASNGIILTLVVGDSGIASVSGWMWLPVAVHAISVAAAVLGLMPRSTSSVNYRNYTHAWDLMRCDAEFAPDIAEEVVQELLQVGTGETSPLGDQRAKNTYIVWCARIGIVALALAILAATVVVLAS